MSIYSITSNKKVLFSLESKMIYEFADIIFMLIDIEIVTIFQQKLQKRNIVRNCRMSISSYFCKLIYKWKNSKKTWSKYQTRLSLLSDIHRTHSYRSKISFQWHQCYISMREKSQYLKSIFANIEIRIQLFDNKQSR